MTIAGAHVVFHRLLKVSPDGVSPEKHIQAVLLCKRTQNAPIHPGYWGLFGGRIDSGESADEAVKREVKEELRLGQGLQLDEAGGRLAELTEVAIKRGDQSLRIQYYSCLLSFDLDQLALRPNPHGKVEGEGLAWFTAEEIHHLTVRPEDRIAVNCFFKEHGT